MFAYTGFWKYYIYFSFTPHWIHRILYRFLKQCWNVLQECYVMLSMHRLSELKFLIKIIYPIFHYMEDMDVQRGGGPGLVSWPSSSGSQFSACAPLHLGFPRAVFSEHWPRTWHCTGHCWAIMIVVNY